MSYDAANQAAASAGFADLKSDEVKSSVTREIHSRIFIVFIERIHPKPIN